MPIFKTQGLNLVAQPKDAVCWWASATMLYKWSKKSGMGSMIDPLSDSGFAYRYEQNLDWPSEQNGYMASQLRMKQIEKIDLSYSSLSETLQKRGPIFAGVERSWGGVVPFGHAIVIGGGADTGVLVYDPWPVNRGCIIWLTWAQIRKAIDAITQYARPQFLAAA